MLKRLRVMGFDAGDLVEAIRILETDLPRDVEASIRRCEEEEGGNAKVVLAPSLRTQVCEGEGHTNVPSTGRCLLRQGGARCVEITI